MDSDETIIIPCEECVEPAGRTQGLIGHADRGAVLIGHYVLGKGMQTWVAAPERASFGLSQRKQLETNPALPASSIAGRTAYVQPRSSAVRRWRVLRHMKDEPRWPSAVGTWG